MPQQANAPIIHTPQVVRLGKPEFFDLLDTIQDTIHANTALDGVDCVDVADLSTQIGVAKIFLQRETLREWLIEWHTARKAGK